MGWETPSLCLVQAKEADPSSLRSQAGESRENEDPGRFLGRELTVQKPSVGGKLAGYHAGLDQLGHGERAWGLDMSGRVAENGWSDSTCH